MLAADRLGQLLNGKGKVLLLRYAEGSASTNEREEGFLSQIKAKFPDIQLVSTDQYAGATRDTAKRASENLLNQFGDRGAGHLYAQRIINRRNVAGASGYRQGR